MTAWVHCVNCTEKKCCYRSREVRSMDEARAFARRYGKPGKRGDECASGAFLCYIFGVPRKYRGG